jgi:multimeric flavodoxin WrbA
MEDNMRKKVLAINGSKRKLNTFGLLKSICNELEKHNIETELINVTDFDIKGCIGCEACLRKDKCVIKDDADVLMEKLKSSDGIILGSPVYMGNISGNLKVFIDRTCRWFHRPELVGKPSLAIVTTAGSGLKDTSNYIEKVLIQWGTMPTGSITRNVKTLRNPLKQDDIKIFVEYINSESSNHHRPSFNQVIHFQVQKVLAEKILDIDKQFWIDKDWLSRIYYYDCNIGFVKKLLGKSFYRFLSKKVKKVNQ